MIRVANHAAPVGMTELFNCHNILQSSEGVPDPLRAGWPIQARFWLEWGSSKFGQNLAATRASDSASEEVTLNWNKWIRQTHRWLSMAFTVAVIINIVAIAQKKYTASVGLLAVIPLALQFLTGLYLFVLPYATKWRSARGAD